MYSALLRHITALKSKIPVLKYVRFDLNFIVVHYVYIISSTIIVSIIIYPHGGIRYIDALFQASGAVTQSGLNTVNFNDIYFYQQLVLYLSFLLCCPAFIHTALVFVRLYWFEKRFQQAVQNARVMRPTRSTARTLSAMKDRQSVEAEERGVSDRSTVVLRNSTESAQSEGQGSHVGKSSENVAESSDYKGDIGECSEKQSGSQTDQSPLDTETLRYPGHLSPEHHIAFLEKQRRDEGALRIPSPREYERGGVPELVGQSNDDIKRTETQQSDNRSSQSSEESDRGGPFEQHITIEEPDMSRARARNSTFPRMESRPTVRDTDEQHDLRANSWKTNGPFSGIFRSLTREKERPTLPYLSWNATVERNSNFVNLTDEQRDELGGIEYRALKVLALLLVCYFVVFQLIGVISLIPWILTEPHWGSIVKAEGVGCPWWAIFTSGSAFSNCGYTLTPDSMISFQDTVWPLLYLGFLIVIGNTGFPCMLRLIIWCMAKVVPKTTALWEELTFLLDHPRRCFTLLFPRNATWWLVAVLVLLNGIDLIFFIILDLHDPTVTALPGGYRVLDGLFQAVSTRTCGFAVVNLAALHPAIQVSYMIMMYISVLPIAISVRRTNVYEEMSLGIYSSDEHSIDETTRAPSYIGFHLRRQLGFDLWFLFLAVFIIAIAEGNRLMSDNNSFQLWDILFEVVSAYGTVGLSLGYPNTYPSLSGQFGSVSKLVIIAVEIRGRHRGLPYALDRAILLPSDKLDQQDANEQRLIRRASNASNMFSMSREQSVGSLRRNNSRRDANAQRNSGVSSGVDAYGHELQPLNRDSTTTRRSTD